MAQKADRSGEGFKNAVFDLADLKLDVKPYYPPGNILFQLNLPREILKKNVGLKQVHKLVQKANDAGLLTR